MILHSLYPPSDPGCLDSDIVHFNGVLADEA
jgi:hypothetical protein